MTDELRNRAIGAAQALLHQPGAADAGEAWQVVGQLGRLGVELRAARDEAVRAGGSPAWLEAAADLAARLEEAAAWWTGRSPFPWSTWDESSSAALGSLLCELDALAAALLTAADADANADAAAASFEPAASGSGAPSAFAASLGAAPETETVHARSLSLPRSLSLTFSAPGRSRAARLIPSIGFASAAVVGVIGGISVAASHSSGHVPRRSIASVPVPYTLHDVGSTGAADAAGTPGAAGVGQPGASAGTGTRAQAASPALAPSAAGTAPAAPGHPRLPRGVRRPQPRSAVAPPPIPAALPGQDQFATIIASIRAHAARQLQEDQLRELAHRDPGNGGIPAPPGIAP